MCCETLLRRSEECIASTCEDSEEQQSDFERTEDSDSQGRWDTNFGEMTEAGILAQDTTSQVSKAVVLDRKER